MGSCLEVAGDFVEETAVGAVGWFCEGHSGFFGGAVSFFGVAATAGNDHVFPDIFATARSGDDMVQGHQFARIATVLTGATVAVEKVSAGEGDFVVGNADVLAQADDGGHGQVGIEDAIAHPFKLFSFSFD